MLLSREQDERKFIKPKNTALKINDLFTSDFLPLPWLFFDCPE